MISIQEKTWMIPSGLKKLYIVKQDGKYIAEFEELDDAELFVKNLESFEKNKNGGENEQEGLA